MSPHQSNHYSPRVILLTQLFYPEMVSTGQTMTELAEELVRQGVTVDVICGPPTVTQPASCPPKKMTYKGISIRRVWGTQFPKLNFLGKLMNQLTFALGVIIFLLTHRISSPIIVNTNPPFLAWICALSRRLGGPQFIYLLFDIYPETAIECGVLSSKGMTVQLWRLINKWTYKHSQKIITIGRCMADRIRPELSKLSIPKLYQTHIWADDSLLSSTQSDTFRAEWGLQDKFIVLYSGNMGRFHDMETIMDAAALLENKTTIQWVFVGDGYQKQWCQNYVTSRALSNCHFYPYVDKSELPKLLATADVGLVSLNASQWGLSVPSKAIGLMAASRPTIAVMPPKSEIAQLITQYHCGYVVPNGNSQILARGITQLYDSPDTAKKMGQKARQLINASYTLYHTGKFFKKII